MTRVTPMSTIRVKLLVLLCLVTTSAFAGQSLVLTPGVHSTAMNDPNLAATQAWRVEFQMHDWAPPSIATNDGFVWALNGIGASAAVVPGNQLQVIDTRDTIPGGSPCNFSLDGRTNVLVRIQREPAANRFVCEIWNSDGTGYAQNVLPIQSFLNWIFSGGGFGTQYTTARVGFFRVFLTTVADGGRPPVTADSGDWTNLKFDGNGNDSSGHGHDLTFPGATFQTTPNQNPASFLQTLGAPTWSPWVSLRAGFPATLDGTSSFSMADQSSTVSYFWQQLSGPTNVIWSDRSSGRPTIKGLIFGTYSFRLKVTDAAGQTAIKDLSLGAVATDDKGVVVQANPAADIIFGPMIAFGKNPWPFEDQMNLHSAIVRQPELALISPPAWANPLPGTISYAPGAASQMAQTVLSNGIGATDQTIPVNSASVFDLSSFPTVLMIHAVNTNAPIEEVRICGANGNVLTVCYDGRGWKASTFERVSAPQSWIAGSAVLQVETVGTGTTFLTSFCPGGAGEPGAVMYSTGTVTPIPGQATLSGVGTAWTTNIEGLRIRIQGTHGGGTPFVFFAGITQVTSNLSLVMSRSWPTDADPGTFPYAAITGGATIARGWIRPDGSNGLQNTSVSTCESNTRMFQGDLFSGVPTAQANQTYTDGSTTWVTDFGPNYYDEVLAHYAGYFRSGYDLFLNNARAIGDYWAKQPGLDEGWQGTSPRRTSDAGMVAGAVLDGRVSNFYTIRKLAQNAIPTAELANCGVDLRESSYTLSWLAFAALFDPVDTGSATEPNQRSYWKAHLANAYARDNNCKSPANVSAFDPAYNSANSFPSSYWPGSGTYQLTTGSKTVTGTNIPATLCSFVSQGNIIVTRGNMLATGVGFTPNAKIVILGKKLTQPYLFYSFYVVTSPTSITLASPYDGDSGVYTYHIESDTSWLSFATDPLDYVNANTLYVCQPVDSSTITLDRPWTGASGTFGVYRYVELGYGTQPFMAGIKTMAMKWASQGASGATANNYANLANQVANWVLTTGFDSVSKGLHYARGWAGCEPENHPRMNCTYGTDANNRQSARFLNGEAQNAMRVAYEANPTQQTRDFGDQFYGAQWGKLGGPWYDDVYLSNIEQDSIWSYKWLGFLFGVGMAHQWPAVRLGGVQAAILLNSTVSINLSAFPGAVSARVVVTQPSSAQTPYLCSGSPCSVTIDQRQGAHWYQISYLDAGGKVLGQSDPGLIEVQ